jgi:hypothetical protein
LTASWPIRVIPLATLILMIAPSNGLTQAPSPEGSPDTVYVYSFFREPNGVAGLRLAWSEDLFQWRELPGPHFRPTVGSVPRDGEPGGRVFRDPFVAPDPEGGFHLVWTTGWDRRDIGYAHSPDLVHWEDERLLPVMADREATENCWAPKLFYDQEARVWMILWSTTLADDTFPKPVVPGTSRNHRIWHVTTRDFRTLSEARVLFDPGHSCIDAYLLRDGSEHRLFFKDERANDESVAAFDPRYQNIRFARGDGPQGPFRDISPPITGRGQGVWMNEGPSAIEVDDAYYVFYDHHGEDPYFGVVRSRDLVSWEDVTERFRFPPRSKHGHIFRVRRDAVQRLIDSERETPGARAR